MKLPTKILIFCFSTFSYATAPIAIHYQSDLHLAQKLAKIVQKKFEIPPELIEISYQQKPCQKNQQTKKHWMVLCLENKKLKTAFFNKKQSDQSLKIFRSFKVDEK